MHLYSMCGGIKTVKHNVRTMLQLTYQDCKNLTHHEQNTSGKTHPNRCHFEVRDSRVFYFFRLVTIEHNWTVRLKDVKFEKQNSREKIFTKGFKYAQGDLRF